MNADAWSAGLEFATIWCLFWFFFFEIIDVNYDLTRIFSTTLITLLGKRTDMSGTP